MKLIQLLETRDDHKVLSYLEENCKISFNHFLRTGSVLIRTDPQHRTKDVILPEREEERTSKHTPHLSTITQDLGKWDPRWKNFDPRGFSTFFLMKDVGNVIRVLNTPFTIMGAATHFCFPVDGAKYNVCGGTDFNTRDSWPALNNLPKLSNHEMNLVDVLKLTHMTRATDPSISHAVKDISTKKNVDSDQLYQALSPEANGFFVTKDPSKVPADREVWISDVVVMLSPSTLKKLLILQNP